MIDIALIVNAVDTIDNQDQRSNPFMYFDISVTDTNDGSCNVVIKDETEEDEEEDITDGNFEDNVGKGGRFNDDVNSLESIVTIIIATSDDGTNDGTTFGNTYSISNPVIVMHVKAGYNLSFVSNNFVVGSRRLKD